MIWDLVLRLTGQLRNTMASDRIIVTGLDMTAALALAAGLGITPRLAAEFLPDIEAAMVSALNDNGTDATAPEEEANDV